MPDYTYPTNSGREGNAHSYYQGMPFVSNSTFESQRIYDRRTAIMSYIEQGRAAFSRLLFGYARAKGAVVVKDTEPRWGIEYKRLPRVAHTAASTTTGVTNANDIFKVGLDGARLQEGDILYNVGFWQDIGRTNVATGVTAKTSTYCVPEAVKVLQVTKYDATTYYITVQRNWGGPQITAGTTWATTTSMFLWKGSPSLLEGSDDQLIYSDTNDWDYNYTQYIMRKWGATETENNVDRFFSNGETPYQRNARRKLGEFFDELDVTALLGTRRKEQVGGKTKWYAGGLLEFIPSGNIVAMDDSTFLTKNFNALMKDKFYYGSQTKIMLCGQNVYTGMSNMLDNKIILPAAQNSFGVELQMFKVANGGTVLLAPSDTMSLNGLQDHAVLYDPSTFKYGHLQNMDIKQIEVNGTNPHEKTGEIYGQVTFIRENPDANFMFVYNGQLS